MFWGFCVVWIGTEEALNGGHGHRRSSGWTQRFSVTESLERREFIPARAVENLLRGGRESEWQGLFEVVQPRRVGPLHPAPRLSPRRFQATVWGWMKESELSQSVVMTLPEIGTNATWHPSVADEAPRDRGSSRASSLSLAPNAHRPTPRKSSPRGRQL